MVHMIWGTVILWILAVIAVDAMTSRSWKVTEKDTTPHFIIRPGTGGFRRRAL
jgi:hypothetical protein